MAHSGTVGTSDTIQASQWNALEQDFSEHTHSGAADAGALLMSLSLEDSSITRIGTPYLTTTTHKEFIRPARGRGEEGGGTPVFRKIGTADPGIGVPAFEARDGFEDYVAGFTVLPANCYGGGTICCLGMLGTVIASSQAFDSQLAVSICGTGNPVYYGTVQTVTVASGSVGTIVRFGSIPIGSLNPNNVITLYWRRDGRKAADTLTSTLYFIGWELTYRAL